MFKTNMMELSQLNNDETEQSHFDAEHIKTVTEWIRIRHLMQTVHESSVLTLSLNKIIESINDVTRKKSIINFLIQEGNSDELVSMYKIIKHQQSEYHNSTKKSISPITNNNHTIQLFNNISTESIANICSYLNRKDIVSFKMVTSRIGIICLEEMMKYKIGILNGNNLLNINSPKLLIQMTYLLNRYDTYNWTRYHLNQRYISLYDKWDEMYSIPEQFQLLFHFEIGEETEDFSMTLIDSLSRRKQTLSSYTTLDFIVIDKRNTIILTPQSANIVKNNQNISELKNYKLMLLQYFDLFNQTTKTIQFLLISQNVSFERIYSYILNEFISTNNTTSIWYNNLQSKFKEMNTGKNQNASSAKLRFIMKNDKTSRYQTTDILKYQFEKQIRNFPDCLVVMFQIEFQHDIFYNDILDDNDEIDLLDKLEYNYNKTHTVAWFYNW
eukprot:140814_1